MKISKQTTEKIELLLGAAKASMLMYETTGMQWYKEEVNKAYRAAQELYRADLQDATGIIDMRQYIKKECA
jgi:hypothetical protein